MCWVVFVCVTWFCAILCLSCSPHLLTCLFFYIDSACCSGTVACGDMKNSENTPACFCPYTSYFFGVLYFSCICIKEQYKNMHRNFFFFTNQDPTFLFSIGTFLLFTLTKSAHIFSHQQFSCLLR